MFFASKEIYHDIALQMRNVGLKNKPILKKLNPRIVFSYCVVIQRFTLRYTWSSNLFVYGCVSLWFYGIISDTFCDITSRFSASSCVLLYLLLLLLFGANEFTRCRCVSLCFGLLHDIYGCVCEHADVLLENMCTYL